MKPFGVIPSQAPIFGEGVETIPLWEYSDLVSEEAPRARKGDDIVHPQQKRWDKCNEMVVGSNPTRGASEKTHNRRKADLCL